MKRLLAILITLSMLLGCGCAAAETATYQIEMKTFPTYSIANPDWKVDFPLYFVDGADDLPFVDLSDWTDVMNEFFADDGYQLTFEAKEAENVALLVREDPSNTMEVDFNKGTISFLDYVAFILWPHLKRIRTASPSCCRSRTAGTCTAITRCSTSSDTASP